jgi:hypothetical protein
MDFTREAVDNLVTQFSSALDFYRELVQNSIDAGSAAIDIWLDFIPDESGGATGVIEIHVDDFGEGMNEAIIDEQLTTLFSSTKENDLTKIGKFGIGFVSVFAPKPRGVLVRTGRDGQHWEVFFDQDRSFFKSPLATPVEGTQITLFLTGDRARYTELVRDSRTTIDHWCRHSEAEIHFEDRASIDGISELINKPFAVDGECLTRFERDGTEIVLAYSSSPVWGFYNKGLALAVVRGDNDLVPASLAHVGFRIKSRYLEHTLARETVMRDGNYDRAMAMVAEAATGPLRAALVAALVELVELGTQRRWSASERGRYFRLMGYLGREGSHALAPFMAAKLLLGLDGRAYSLDQLVEQAAADARVFVDHESSPLVRGLLAQGTPVILIPAPQEQQGEAVDGRMFGPVTRVLANGLAREFSTTKMLARALDNLRGKPEVSAWIKAGELVVRPAAVIVAITELGAELGSELGEEQGAAALVAATEGLLQTALGGGPSAFARAWSFVRRKPLRFGFGRLVAARVDAGPGLDRPLFVVAHAIAPLMAIPPKDMLVSERPLRPEAAVNVDHPHFRALLRLSREQPAIAAYALAKALLLDEDRGLEFDGDLIEAALQLQA